MSGRHIILYTLSTVLSISLKFFLKVQKRSGKKIQPAKYSQMPEEPIKDLLKANKLR